MVRKFPGKSSRKFENCWISEKRTIQPKIPEIQVFKLNRGEISRKNVRKFGYTSRGCHLFWKLCKVAIFYSALVLLATITASWISHVRTTATRIQNLSTYLSINTAVFQLDFYSLSDGHFRLRRRHFENQAVRDNLAEWEYYLRLSFLLTDNSYVVITEVSL